MNNKPSIRRLIELQELLLKFRSIERKSFIPPENKVNENDVEHSYNLAMFAWFISTYFEDIDTNKVILLALAHDIVEVHAGDTFYYGDKKDLDSKQARETEAQNKLASEWSDFPGLNDAIKEYELRSSDEAKFVYSLDKLMPTLLNYQGNGYLWKKYGITMEKYREEKEAKMPVSKEIYPYYEEILEILKTSPDMFPSSN